jgi:hypothetical protein
MEERVLKHRPVPQDGPMNGIVLLECVIKISGIGKPDLHVILPMK